MSYQTNFLLLFSIFTCTAAFTLKAAKIYLVAGEDVRIVDNEDEATHCIYGIPFNETDDTILALTFDTHPRKTTCYIGQAAWQHMFQGWNARGSRGKWIAAGLDPAGRKTIAIRIFKRIEGSTDHYQLVKLYSIQTITPTERAGLIETTQEYRPAPEAYPTAIEIAAIPDTGHGAAAAPAEYWGGTWGLRLHVPALEPTPVPAPALTPYQAARALSSMPVPEGITPQQWEGVILSLEATGQLILMNNQLTTEQLRRIITLLPEIIRDSITFLNVPNNQLTALPAEIGNLRNLNDISIYGNQITVLPEEITHLEHLIQIRMDPAVTLPTGLRTYVRIDRVPDPLHPGAHLRQAHSTWGDYWQDRFHFGHS